MAKKAVKKAVKKVAVKDLAAKGAKTVKGGLARRVLRVK